MSLGRIAHGIDRQGDYRNPDKNAAGSHPPENFGNLCGGRTRRIQSRLRASAACDRCRERREDTSSDLASSATGADLSSKQSDDGVYLSMLD
jgi:hypothetical protein